MHIGRKYLTLYTFGLDLLWFHSRLIVWLSIEIFYFSSLGLSFFPLSSRSECCPENCLLVSCVQFSHCVLAELACKISWENMSCVWNVEDFLSIQIIPLFLIFLIPFLPNYKKKSNIYTSSSCCVSPQQIRLWYVIPHSYTIL